MGDNLEGAGRGCRVGEGAPTPCGPVAPSQDLASKPKRGAHPGVQGTDSALGGGGGGRTCFCWEVRGLVLTRVPPACVLLCQRGRVSSTGEGGQGSTAAGGRAPGWGEVDNEQ